MDITEQHIRCAKNNQLAQLLDTSPQTVSGWQYGKHYSERRINIGVSKGIPKEVLISGIELRRQDAAKANQLQSELATFLDENSRASDSLNTQEDDHLTQEDDPHGV